eukprot:3898671-Rhodomonas_salina.1
MYSSGPPCSQRKATTSLFCSRLSRTLAARDSSSPLRPSVACAPPPSLPVSARPSLPSSLSAARRPPS